ncbi:heterokaryon incompatibility protein-domain-containing protein, partial [Massariosphaeria phaeospora]
MHLVHSQTIQLHDFIGEYIPPYAILSHRWENEEITYTDMQRGSRRKRRSKAGYAKLKKSCAQASKDGLEYVWIDTCCIDKSSSAELSEAINSMFKWYRDANICYAYLSDVRFWFPENPEAVSHFQASMWFTRGWTLQELIAPKIVNFFMCGPTGWDLVGSKNDLLSILAGSTGINESVLRGEDFRNCSVATRMSWAARRVTTRAEDLAYCLLGLFDVNMPLLYGEGEKAFIRLQEEIMRGSDDHSLFVWRSKSSKTSKMTSRLSGLLADSPSQFRDCPTLVSLPDFASSVPYSMTNRGLQIELPLVEG